MSRRISVLCASAAAVTCLTLAGSASAAPASFSGTVPNGGCDTARTVTVSGPARIEIEVASTSAAVTAFGEIVTPGGAVAATGSYDTPAGGAYAVRVCTQYSAIDPPSLQYTATFATGPAGQPALPRTQGAVLATTTTLSRDVHGSGAIRTRAGLAWFTVKLDRAGAATVRVYDPRASRHYVFRNSTVTFLTSGVRITRGGMTLTLLQRSASDRVVFSSPRFRAHGTVVRGGYLIV